jgi:hypothetical protein
MGLLHFRRSQVGIWTLRLARMDNRDDDERWKGVAVVENMCSCMIRIREIGMRWDQIADVKVVAFLL